MRRLLLLIAALCFACSESANLLDAGAPADTGVLDTGPSDSGAVDTSISLDANPADTGPRDAADAGDSGTVRDVGPSDADAADLGFDLDGDIPDVELSDFGFGFDGSIPDISFPDIGFGFDGSIPDVSFPGDGGLPTPCTSAADCSSMRSPPSVNACPTSAWSCVTGSCEWECTGGESCTIGMTGCITCGATTLGCAGDPCASGLVPIMLEQATCARDFLNPAPAACFGGFVILTDGTICTVEVLPTGAQRSVLSCGGCQTQFIW